MERDTPGGASPGSSSTRPQPTWLFVKPNAVLICTVCETTTDHGPAEMFIDPEYIDSGRMVFVCRCGAHFTKEHFIRAGAELIHRMPRMVKRG